MDRLSHDAESIHRRLGAPWWRRAWAPFRDLAFPPVCPVCFERMEPEAEFLCDRCRKTIEPVPRPRCAVCGALRADGGKSRWCDHCPRRPIHFDSAFAAAAYRGAARDAVKALKFHGRVEMGTLMARRMALALDDEGERLGKIDALIPVPLHFFRRVKRGFNQSEILARELGAMAGLPAFDRALVRPRFTRQQTLLDYDARQRNVAGAFRAVDPGAIQGRTVLLIDDVLTSGATVNECARVLREAGASGIHVFTFARAA